MICAEYKYKVLLRHSGQSAGVCCRGRRGSCRQVCVTVGSFAKETVQWRRTLLPQLPCHVSISCNICSGDWRTAAEWAAPLEVEAGAHD